MLHPLLRLLAASLALAGATLCHAAPAAVVPPRVIPRPQIENYGEGMLTVAEKGESILSGSKDDRLPDSRPQGGDTAAVETPRTDLAAASVQAPVQPQAEQIVIEIVFQRKR